MLVAGPQPSSALLLKLMLAMAFGRLAARGTVPSEFPPKTTPRRPKDTRVSLTIRELKLWVQLTNASWLSAGTSLGYPAAAAAVPLEAALKVLPRLYR